jgi:alkanesulfonate monooxygenase SsuD/methylene tetrahydromethanopterin reductase-like flavin-dependent oxidoreductase (luciferase family)
VSTIESLSARAKEDTACANESVFPSMPLETRREAIIGLATEGDRLGYDGFFLPETWAYDITVLLAEAAARTTRITLGTGILGIWNRSAATIAMAAATLHAMSGGRFVLGLGASTPQLAEGLHDTPFEATGAAHAPDGHADPCAAPRRAHPARGDDERPRAQAQRAAGARACHPRRRARRRDDAARGRAGRRVGALPLSVVAARNRRRTAPRGRGAGWPSGSPPEIHPSVPVVVADTDAKAREGAAWFVSFYVTTMGTVYRDSLTRQGYGKAVEAVLAANAPKFTGAVPADAEELLEQLIVYGTPPEARRRLGRWHEAGAAFPVLLLVRTSRRRSAR